MDHKKSQSSLDFRFMSFFFKILDFFKSPMKKVDKAEVKSGDFVLDYGCGPGSYTFAASEKVGSNGKIYAADIHPLAIDKVKNAFNDVRYVLKGVFNGLNEVVDFLFGDWGTAFDFAVKWMETFIAVKILLFLKNLRWSLLLTGTSFKTIGKA